MDLLEERLKNYKINQGKTALKEERIIQTLQLSKKAFYEEEENKCISYFEFLWGQASYIKKNSWILQFLLLMFLWMILYTANESYQMQRNIGVLSSVFVIIMIPEFWKNKSNEAMEIEAAAYYSLRQIYAARMCLFAMVDVVLLSLFCSMVFLTTQITIQDIVIQFFLPLNVNCCICCRILCSKRFNSEYVAVSVSIIWAAVWFFFICSKGVFEVISTPAWVVSILFSVLYLCFCLRKVIRNCNKYWEYSYNL